MTQVDVIKSGGKWQVRVEESGEPTVLLSTRRVKVNAVLIGIGAAKVLRCELIVRDRKGAIRVKNSYGNDPRDVRG